MTDISLRAPEYEVVFYGSEQHYRDHLFPIFLKATNVRGHLWAWAGETKWEGDGSAWQFKDRVVVVASWTDLLYVRKRGARKIILMEHGSGQSYTKRHQSYVGGQGRDKAALVLLPNFQALERHRQFYKDRVPAEVVGCPKLDDWVDRHPKPRSDPPKVCISFHWDCKVAPEAGTVWGDYGLEAIEALVQMRDAGEIGLLVHAHPRIADEVRTALFERWPVAFVDSFEVVAERADLYVCDNSSSMFEFAALGRPVLVMNSPRWRRNVHHGGRFWDWAGVGVQVSRAEDLAMGVEWALSDDSMVAEDRRSVVRDVYPYIGASTDRTIAAIARVEAS